MSQGSRNRNLQSTDWTVLLKLAIACRELAAEGHALTPAG